MVDTGSGGLCRLIVGDPGVAGAPLWTGRQRQRRVVPIGDISEALRAGRYEVQNILIAGSGWRARSNSMPPRNSAARL